MHTLGGKAMKSSLFDLANARFGGFHRMWHKHWRSLQRDGIAWSDCQSERCPVQKGVAICVTKRLRGLLEIWKSWEKSGKSDHISQSERRPRCSWAPGLLALHCVVARALTSLKRTVAEAHLQSLQLQYKLKILCMKVKCRIHQSVRTSLHES